MLTPRFRFWARLGPRDVRPEPSQETFQNAVKKGAAYECSVCGLVVSVDEVCGCIDTCDIICCEKPIKAKKKAA